MKARLFTIAIAALELACALLFCITLHLDGFALYLRAARYNSLKPTER